MRAVLLSDAQVSRFLADNFELCWYSLRPAPKVTIDFGNGHKLERTLKGNTVFHVLNTQGQVLDSLPGVYLPEDFLRELEKSLQLVALNEPSQVVASHLRQNFGAPVGGDASLSKAVLQGPLLRTIEPTSLSKAVLQSPLVNSLESAQQNSTQGNIVDVSALPLTAEEVSEAYLPGAGTLGERALREDSQSSVRVLRPAVHRWYAGRTELPSLAESRSYIYKSILKVDIDDPYLGLKVDGIPGTQ